MWGSGRSLAGRERGSPCLPSTSGIEILSTFSVSLTFRLIISNLIKILASIVAGRNGGLVTVVSLSLVIFPPSAPSTSRPRPRLPGLARNEADQRRSGQISGGQDGLAGR